MMVHLTLLNDKQIHIKTLRPAGTRGACFQYLNDIICSWRSTAPSLWKNGLATHQGSLPKSSGISGSFKNIESDKNEQYYFPTLFLNIGYIKVLDFSSFFISHYDEEDLVFINYIKKCILRKSNFKKEEGIST